MPFFPTAVGRLVGRALLLLPLLALLARPATAQTPPWVLATAVGGTTAVTRALVPDAAGNLVVVGFFNGQLTLGSTVLTSAGNSDWFVAKYAPASNTWLWAVRGGGTGFDYAYGVAVSGSSVYVTGLIVNNTANGRQVTFGGTTAATSPLPLAGASAGAESNDAVLIKLTDNGSSATAVWGQVAGGTSLDVAYGVAVSGSSVYVTGVLINNQVNGNAVVFGGSGLAAGTVPQAGAAAGTPSEDLFLAKYTDGGTSGTFVWSQVGGGTGYDLGYGLAVSGSSIYVGGGLTNSLSNDSGVLFGGSRLAAGTSRQYGAATFLGNDLLLAKYTDNGSTGTLGWTQVGGGTGDDNALGVAVSGSRVYLTGHISNTLGDAAQVRFGGTGTTPGTLARPGATSTNSPDLVLAAYTDSGPAASVAWATVGGGTASDQGNTLSVLGNRVYVSGYFYNSSANSNGVAFGGSLASAPPLALPGASSTASYDVFAVGYLDQGAAAVPSWAQAAGGPDVDYSLTTALVGTRLYVGGLAIPPATFGALTISTPAGSNLGFMAALDLSATLATAPAAAGPTATVFPNPAAGPALLSGAAPATGGQVVDALGRTVATFRTDAGGAAALPAGLPPGLYLVRVGAATGRWVVE